MNNTLVLKEGEAMAENVVRQLRIAIATEYPKLVDVWNELWDPAERQKRKEILETHFTETFTNLMEGILNKELETKEEYITRVEKLLDEIAKLEGELGVKIPHNDVETLPLHCMAKRLNQKAQKYRHILQERVDRLNELRTQEAALVEAMGFVPAQLDLPVAPNDAHLESLAQRVNDLEVEKRNRVGIFMEKRQRILELYTLLGSKPSLLFEKDVVSEERTTDFKVTNENMARLDELLERLKVQLFNAQERRDDILKTLTSMWNYLEEPQALQDKVLKDHPGCTPKDLSGLQVELERCKKEKSANIGKFVERVRATLVAEWDRCLVSEETRNQFRVFRVTYYNEDIYDLHELELERWQRFYAENQRIFELYEQHNELFEKLLELNGRGKSANRYQNRGGQLLQEERQRKKVAKELPRVEEELRSLVTAFMAKNDKPFTYFGRPLVDVLDEKWEANFDQKTIDKFRDCGSASCKGRTPLAVKRPAVTSSSTGAKVSRLAVPSSAKTGSRTARRLYRIDSDQPEPDSTIKIEPSYDDFQKTFRSKLGANKLVSRSTEMLTPMRLLRERTAVGMVSARSSPALATPKTVPRRTRVAVDQTRTPLARNRLPVIL